MLKNILLTIYIQIKKKIIILYAYHQRWALNQKCFLMVRYHKVWSVLRPKPEEQQEVTDAMNFACKSK